MTKADIVNEISKNTGIEKITVQKTVEAFMEAIKDSLVAEKNVYLRGFGSFIVKKRAKKTARNISKNTTIIIPEHFIPSFKPAKSFVAKVDHFFAKLLRLPDTMRTEAGRAEADRRVALLRSFLDALAGELGESKP